MMFLIGLNVDKGRGIIQFIWYWSINIAGIVITYLAILLLLQKPDLTMKDCIDMVSSISTSIHGLLLTISLFYKHPEICDLLKQMDKNFWRPEDISLSQEELHAIQQVYQSMKQKFYGIIFLCSTSYLAFDCQTLFAGEKVLPFPGYIPSWVTFNQMMFYQMLTPCFSQLLPALAMDGLMVTFVGLTQLQFKLLAWEIKNIFHLEENDTEKNYTIKKRIKAVVDHHNFLISFTKAINSTFSGFMICYVVIIIASICVEMYNLSTGNSVGIFVKSMAYTSGILFEFILLFCIPAQNLTDEADRISYNSYFSRWYEHPEHAMAIQMITLTGQRQVNITAGGIIAINLETGLATVKTMISYCMFLRTMSL